jgi:flagellar hook-associated protein 3 FlgL
MRISDRMIQMNTMSGLRMNQARLAEAQRHAASGKRVERLSDDPVDAARAMRMQGQLAGIDQFKRNAVSATTRLATEETALKAARDVMSRARKLAISVTSDDPADPTRAAALQELTFLRDQLVSLGNTRIGDERIFGGGATAPPFLADGTYVGGPIVHNVQVDEGVSVPTSHPGTIFNDAFQAINQLMTSLQAGPATGISATVQPLAAAEEGLLGKEAEAGARQRQIDSTMTQLGSRQQLLLDRSQAILDADPAESLLKVQAATQSIEQAYAVAQRTMSLNIVDWMR